MYAKYGASIVRIVVAFNGGSVCRRVATFGGFKRPTFHGLRGERILIRAANQREKKKEKKSSLYNTRKRGLIEVTTAQDPSFEGLLIYSRR